MIIKHEKVYLILFTLKYKKKIRNKILIKSSLILYFSLNEINKHILTNN